MTPFEEPDRATPPPDAGRGVPGPGDLEDDDGASVSLIGRALGLDRARRHVLVCAGPNCSNPADSDACWSELRLQVRKLEHAGRLLPQAVRLSRVRCLGVCRSGPVAVVYPEGTWYRDLSPELCARLARQHLAGGAPVASHVFCTNDLREGDG
jgi:(2Fe-2S) ferredoxin